MQAPPIIAHRTCPPYAPENSIAGLRIAIEQAADGVEVDLRMSLDQRAYLLHDNTLSRTTGWPLPVELTPSFVIEKLRLRGGDEPPPTLADALDALPPGPLLAVDVKTPWSILPLISQVRRRGIATRTLVWCSSALVARYAQRRLPHAEVAYYKDYEDGPSNISFIARAARLGVRAVSLDWRAIGPEVRDAAHAAGLRVYSWHKQYPLTPEKVACVDGVITDHPAIARKTIEAL